MTRVSREIKSHSNDSCQLKLFCHKCEFALSRTHRSNRSSTLNRFNHFDQNKVFLAEKYDSMKL